METDLQLALQECLASNKGEWVEIKAVIPVSGGCIHQACLLETNGGDFFLKYNQLSELANFEAEADGLNRLSGAGCLPSPHPIGVGSTASQAWFLMEYIPTKRKNPRFWEDFGHGLAEMHRITASQFGLDKSNFIGRLPQINDCRTNWIDFFVEMRLEKQLQLAEEIGLADAKLRKQFERLYRKLPDLLPVEPASLLHGDLWSGNFKAGSMGAAVVFDPAVYYGHREAELAFTHLFGGFSEVFYRAYQNNWALQKGWESRVGLLNLYPLTVHLNLFGRGYLPEIQSILAKFA